MDTALIVFVIGTIASFLPMYWVALRLLGRQRRRALSRNNAARIGGQPAGRREFLDLLRQEAAQRAVVALREALVEAQLAADHAHGDHHALSALTRHSLHEAGRLVDSLFSGELRKTFRDGIDMLMTATSSSIGAAAGAATVAIAAFERVLEGDGSGVAAPAHGLRSVLRIRRRGWFGTGTGGVGVTA